MLKFPEIDTKEDHKVNSKIMIEFLSIFSNLLKIKFI